MAIDHSILPPSSADRGVVCPASWTMSARYPQDDTPDTLIGTAAHWVASEMASGNLLIEAGTMAPNGVEITPVMIEQGWVWVDMIQAVGGKRRIEQRVDIHAVAPECFGTPDVQIDGENNHLHIYDFKNGHRHVEAYECWQLICYAAGVLDEYSGLDDQHITVHLKIYQPNDFHRDGPIREWVVRASDLRPYINRLAAAAGDAMSDTPTYRPTVDGCRDCPGRHECEALQRGALDGAQGSKGWLPLKLSNEALGRELRALQDAQGLIEARVTGLHAQAAQLLKNGQSGLGFVMESGTGRAAWQVPAAKVASVGDLYGVDLRRPLDVVTPTQALKLIDASIINDYIVRPTGAPALVRVEHTLAFKAFTQGK